MYKIASQNAQRRTDFIKLAELAGGEETMTPQQKYEAAKARWRQLCEMQAAEKDKTKKKALGVQVLELQQLITELRRAAKLQRPGMDISHYIADATKQMVTHAMWHAIVRRAEELRAAQEQQ
jgi:hypothetical protein